jgi:peptide-methionine (S)-S-oxide reductase
MDRLALALCLGISLLACRSVGTSSDVRADRAAATPSRTERRQIGTEPGGVGAGTPLTPRPGNALAAFAAGCFWGVEDNLRQVPGVVATAVGYTGGHTTKPTYESVCSHTTGHAEAVLVEFDPTKVTYDDLLRVFFMNHDPTTPNRQGPDVGDQYRSAIFTFSPEQAEAARRAIAASEKRLGERVVTEVAPIRAFWKAEDYHQQYDEKTGTHSCPVPKGVRGT